VTPRLDDALDRVPELLGAAARKPGRAGGGTDRSLLRVAIR
jgi:hypothetical protein